jgi:hypothetical protein
LEWVARFAKGVRQVVRRGNLSFVLSPEFVARLAADRLRIRSYAPPVGASVECTVTPQDDLLLGQLRADLAEVTRLDVLVCGGDGELRARLEDIPFPAVSAADLVFNYPIDVARSVGHDVMVVKLLAVESGVDHPLGEYTFNHYPARE